MSVEQEYYVGLQAIATQLHRAKVDFQVAVGVDGHPCLRLRVKGIQYEVNAHVQTPKVVMPNWQQDSFRRLLGTKIVDGTVQFGVWAVRSNETLVLNEHSNVIAKYLLDLVCNSEKPDQIKPIAP